MRSMVLGHRYRANAIAQAHWRHARVSHLVHSFIRRVLRNSVDKSSRVLIPNLFQNRPRIPRREPTVDVT